MAVTSSIMTRDYRDYRKGREGCIREGWRKGREGEGEGRIRESERMRIGSSFGVEQHPLTTFMEGEKKK